jgi:tripartite-type tricarboxylate transporter receptor subunit TctC
MIRDAGCATRAGKKARAAETPHALANTAAPARRVHPMISKRSIALVLAASLPCLHGAAMAQSWPTRSVTMVVPFAAGGGTDVLGRIIGQRLSEVLGQQVIIENVGGAGGMVGSARVAKAAPDGYQFVLGSRADAINQTLYRNPLYNLTTDLAPVVLVAEQPTVLITRKDYPARNLQDFIAYARKNQDAMQFASAGAGSTGHVDCALFNAAIGVKITHVPYRGGGPALQDIIGGRIDYFCTLSGTIKPQIESNLVNAVAVLTRERSPLLPTVASAREQGLPDFEASTWFGLFVPKGTPAAIVQKLHDATVAAMDTPAVQERLSQAGATTVAPERRSPEYLQQFVGSEIERNAKPIKAAGIAIE